MMFQRISSAKVQQCALVDANLFRAPHNRADGPTTKKWVKGVVGLWEIARSGDPRGSISRALSSVTLGRHAIANDEIQTFYPDFLRSSAALPIAFLFQSRHLNFPLAHSFMRMCSIFSPITEISPIFADVKKADIKNTLLVFFGMTDNERHWIIRKESCSLTFFQHHYNIYYELINSKGRAILQTFWMRSLGNNVGGNDLRIRYCFWSI